jgi:hypothetical protein
MVRDPRIKTVGFTGSRSGGLALMGTRRCPARADLDVRRDVVDQPVVVLPGALEDGDAGEVVQPVSQR